MIPKDPAMVQLNRGKGLPRFPVESEAWNEVVNAMRTAARSAPHAKLIMDRLLETARFFPVPAEIYEAGREIIPPELAAPFEGPRNCSACGGTGFLHGLFLVTYDNRKKRKEPITPEQAENLAGKLAGIGIQQIYGGSEYCVCSYGQNLKAKRLMQETSEEQEQHSTVNRKRG